MTQRTARMAAAAIAAALAAAGCGSDRSPPRMQSMAYKLPPPPPKRQSVPIDSDLRRSAVAELAAEAASTDPVQRANAVEAMQKTLGAIEAPRLLAAVGDPSPVVRFAATMAVGALRLPAAHDRLLTLVDDNNMSVRVGARFALHRLGDTRYSHELEALAQDADPRVRSNTALALGLLGEKSALAILRPMQNDPSVPVRLQALDARWRLGDEDARNKLVTGTISKYPDDQIVCLLALAATGDRSIIRYLRAQLTSDYLETKLAAARAVGMLGEDDGMAVALSACGSSDVRQRSMAALALGAIARPDAQSKLGPMLRDRDPSVRLAAATALLQLKADGRVADSR